MHLFNMNRSARSDATELLDLLDKNAGVGLWDAILHDGDPMHELSKWTWSSEFRRIVGFTNQDEFPNIVGSWADRLHPDDVENTFDLFSAALSGEKQGYDAIYRLKVRDGSYKWFRATGGVAHNKDGVPLRTCGSLVDINEAKCQEIAREERVVLLDTLAAKFDTL